VFKFIIFIALLIIPTVALADTNIIDTINSETVVLVKTDADHSPFCGGVWITNHSFLTANHCVDALVKFLKYSQKKNDDAITPINAIGLEINYAVKNEVSYNDKIIATHKGYVSHIDPTHDLALIESEKTDTPGHNIAHIANTTQLVGESVHVVGHIAGLIWSYTPATISAFRQIISGSEKYGIYGPFIQISGPVWHGNSGGGIFNKRGELIGIVSLVEDNVPSVSLAIPYTQINNFIWKQTLSHQQ
jgi:hypothetical protein